MKNYFLLELTSQAKKRPRYSCTRQFNNRSINNFLYVHWIRQHTVIFNFAFVDMFRLRPIASSDRISLFFIFSKLDPELTYVIFFELLQNIVILEQNKQCVWMAQMSVIIFVCFVIRQGTYFIFPKHGFYVCFLGQSLY